MLQGGCIVGIISQYTYNTSLGLINIEIVLLNHLTISQGGCMGVDTTDFRVCVITSEGIVPHDTHDQCSLIHNINKLNKQQIHCRLCIVQVKMIYVVTLLLSFEQTTT